MADVDWVHVVKDVGFPIAAYGSLAWAIWTVVKWFANEVIHPVRDKAFKFVERLENNVDKMSDNLDQQTVTLRDIHGNQVDIKDALKDIASNGCGAHNKNGCPR